MSERPSLSRNPVSIAGAWLTTLAAVAFITYIALEAFGLIESPYSGLIGFIFLPAVFVAGLLLIPAGLWREARRRRHGRDPWNWPAINLGHSRTRSVILLVMMLTVINIGLVTVATVGAAHTMETDKFCGLVCHTPMKPEYTAHKTTSHASVSCVGCHVAPGAAGTIRAKMNGARQAYEFVTGSYSRPIPSPARNIPVAAETCERCHSASRRLNDVTVVKKEYADDETNTETVSGLVVFADASHWHARPGVVVEYASDATRETIPYMKVTADNGTVTEYLAPGAAAPSTPLRRMDCIDCHSRPAHSMASTPESAVDRAIAAGQIRQNLPYIKREAVAALTTVYASENEAIDAIGRQLASFYASTPTATKSDVDGAIGIVRDLYRTNVFPDMKITWGTYKSQLGHPESSGCFRCHDDEHKSPSGAVVRQDCELCHKDQ